MENIHVNKAKTNLLIDISIFIVFLIVYEVKATGETIHEWMGIVIGFIFIIHIILHWQWIVVTTKHFLTSIKSETRLNYIVDVIIFIGFTTIIFTGIMISKSFLPTFGIRVAENHFWREMHSISVDLTLFFTALHFALHWEWIVNNCKRYIIHPLKNKNSSIKLTEPELVLATKSASFHFVKLVKASGKFFIVLIFSSIISLGWYSISGTISSPSNFQDHRPGLEENIEAEFNADANKRSDQFRPDHDKHHDEGGLFILEVLKNLIIFAVVTLLVTKISNKIKIKRRIPING